MTTLQVTDDRGIPGRVRPGSAPDRQCDTLTVTVIPAGPPTRRCGHGPGHSLRTCWCGRTTVVDPRHRPSPAGLGPGHPAARREVRGHRDRPARLRRVARIAGRHAL